MNMTALEAFIRAVPKAEIHLHLEGSIRPARFLELSRRHGTEYRDWDEDRVRGELFRYQDFAGFLNVFKIVCAHLREPADYAALLLDLEEYFSRQNIRYAEIIHTPSIPWKFGGDGDLILETLLEAGREIESKGRVKIRWILDCVRQFGAQAARRTAELAARLQPNGVVAIGLGGDENSLPAEEYAQIFAWARANSLHTHVHAGEIGEPEKIWEALKVLGANRIGHGIQAARDPRLMDYLRDHAVGLDICLTSNVQTKAWPLASSNPFWLLHKRGVPVTLGTDDPGLFQTDLCSEYALAARLFELDAGDLAYIALQGVRSSFLDHSEKMQLMQQFQNEIHQLLHPVG